MLFQDSGLRATCITEIMSLSKVDGAILNNAPQNVDVAPKFRVVNSMEHLLLNEEKNQHSFSVETFSVIYASTLSIYRIIPIQ